MPAPRKRGRRKKVTGSLRRGGGGGRGTRRQPPARGEAAEEPAAGRRWPARLRFCPALDIARGNGRRRAGGHAAAAKVWSLGGPGGAGRIRSPAGGGRRAQPAAGTAGLPSGSSPPNLVREAFPSSSPPYPPPAPPPHAAPSPESEKVRQPPEIRIGS